jgi:uncharacterized protein (DUF924 family)
MEASTILRFWFEELDPAQWWEKNAELDALICLRFEAAHRAARCGELFGWRTTADGRLAEIIVLDQFSRNMYRDTPQAFASDALALILAQEAVASGAHRALPPPKRSFLLMPYMHSESLLVHEQAMLLFDHPGLEHNLDFERQHKAIIERFGRYPHRNTILGRNSTMEELEFLRQPGSSF